MERDTKDAKLVANLVIASRFEDWYDLELLIGGLVQPEPLIGDLGGGHVHENIILPILYPSSLT